MRRNVLSAFFSTRRIMPPTKLTPERPVIIAVTHLLNKPELLSAEAYLRKQLLRPTFPVTALIEKSTDDISLLDPNHEAFIFFDQRDHNKTAVKLLEQMIDEWHKPVLIVPLARWGTLSQGTMYCHEISKRTHFFATNPHDASCSKLQKFLTFVAERNGVNAFPGMTK